MERPVDALALRAPRVATRIGWLSGALLLAVLVIVSTHVAEERALAYSGGAPRLRDLLPLGLAKLFTEAGARREGAT